MLSHLNLNISKYIYFINTSTKFHENTFSQARVKLATKSRNQKLSLAGLNCLFQPNSAIQFHGKTWHLNQFVP